MWLIIWGWERWWMSLQVHSLSSLKGHGNQARFPMIGKRQKSQMCSWRKPRRRSLLEEVRPSWEVRPSALQTSVSHLSVPVKVIENISMHVKGNRVIWIGQHGISEGRSCLTYLVFLYDQMISSGDNGRTDDVNFERSWTQSPKVSSHLNWSGIDCISGR